MEDLLSLRAVGDNQLVADKFMGKVAVKVGSTPEVVVVLGVSSGRLK